MSNLSWLINAQLAPLSPYFPKSVGKPRVDERRGLSRIVFINRNGFAVVSCVQGVWANKDPLQPLGVRSKPRRLRPDGG